jgi:hypothetical protein
MQERIGKEGLKEMNCDIFDNVYSSPNIIRLSKANPYWIYHDIRNIIFLFTSESSIWGYDMVRMEEISSH